MDSQISIADRWENARGFLNTGLIIQVTRIFGDPRLSEEERQEVLRLSSALLSLPTIDPNFYCDVEIDYSWDSLNWVGRLQFLDGEFSVRSMMFQMEGIKPEFNVQWQHTALKLYNKRDEIQLIHDPAHVWLWVECFRRFSGWWLNLDRHNQNSQGYMKYNSTSGSFLLDAAHSNNLEDDDSIW